MKLLMLKGLPASGKSTYAKELVKEGWVRINKDDMRAMYHNSKHTKANEKFVLHMRNMAAVTALTAGQNVVIDDTNFSPDHLETLKQIASRNGAEFEVKYFDTDVEECIKRDLKRGEKAVGEQVIRRMWRQFVEPVQNPAPNAGHPLAVIFDIDGTLAKMGDRGPFDWMKVDTDTPVRPVQDLARMFYDSDVKVLLFSGRDSVCRELTEKWLEFHNVKYHELHMRPEGDNRKDVLIKEELYDSVKGNYQINWVVDDRPQVCRMWHTKGLCLLKVGDPDLEF